MENVEASSQNMLFLTFVLSSFTIFVKKSLLALIIKGITVINVLIHQSWSYEFEVQVGFWLGWSPGPVGSSSKLGIGWV